MTHHGDMLSEQPSLFDVVLGPHPEPAAARDLRYLARADADGVAPPPPVVELAEEELEGLRWWAAVRFRPKQGFSSTRTWHASGKQEEVDYLGVRAEVAVGRYLGVPPCLEPRLQGDDGVADLWLNGVSVQVKATGHARGRLVFNEDQEFRASVAVLVVAETERRLRLCGYSTRDRFLACRARADLGYGPRSILAQENLLPMHDLLAVVELERIDALLAIESGYLALLPEQSAERAELASSLHRWRERGRRLHQARQVAS